jgi:hypothetical protein
MQKKEFPFFDKSFSFRKKIRKHIYIYILKKIIESKNV